MAVDIQKQITNHMLYEFEVFEHRIDKLINQARKSGVEVIYVRHDDGVENRLTKGTTGFGIYHKFKPIQGELIFDKRVNSSF